MNLKVLFIFYLALQITNGNFANQIKFLDDYFNMMMVKERAVFIQFNLCLMDQGSLVQLQKLANKYQLRYSFKQNNEFNAPKIFITDIKCDFFRSFFSESIERDFLKYQYKWLIFGNFSSISNYYIPINSNVILISKSAEPDENGFILTSPYQIKKETDYYNNSIALWRNRKFLYFNNLNIFKNRTNFFQTPLRVSYIISQNNSLNYQDLVDNRYKHVDKYTKVNYFLYENVAQIWNMTHKVILQTEWGYEWNQEKLFYKGMFGDLCHDRADAGGTVMFIRPTERLKYFKFLVCTAKELKVYFIFRVPSLAYSNNLFALPFHRNLWIACFLTLIICYFVIWLIISWENVEKEKFKSDEHQENSTDFIDIIVMHIGVFCQMEFIYHPKSTSGKIAIFSLLLCFSYIYQAFCARIVILLQGTAQNLNNYRDLYQANFELGVEDTPYDKFYFQNPTGHTNEYWRKLIYNRIVPKGHSPHFYTVQDGLKLVQTSYFAFHAEVNAAGDIIGSTFTNEEICSVRAVDSIYQGDPTYLSCPRNSTITKYLLIGFRRVFEAGLYQRDERRIFSKLPLCTGKQAVFVSVGIIECYFAFELFLIGVLLSFFILIMEILSKRYLNRKNRIIPIKASKLN